MDDSYVKGFTKFGDENDEFGSPKLQKPRNVAKKHYMEPTLSAATKTAKKKILAERNQAFTFTNFLKPPILDSRTSPARSVRSSCSSDYDEEEENSFDGNTSSKKPYDPFTNYLSPRPKFLRYDPNKKRRIFLHGESDITEKKDDLGVISSKSSFESQKVVEETFEEDSVKEDVEPEKTGGDPYDHDDEVEETEEELEEFEEEEEKCWSLLGLLRFLLVLGSVYLTTSFICSMDSTEHSLIQDAIREFRYGFLNQSNTHEVATKMEYFTSKSIFLGGKGHESPISSPNVTQEDIDVEFVEVGISEVIRDDNEVPASTAGLPELKIEKSEDVDDDELIGKVEASDSLQWVEATESETNIDVAASGAEASSDEHSGSDFGENTSAKDEEMGENRDGLDQLQHHETAEVKDMFSETKASSDFNVEFEHMESEEIKVEFEPTESEEIKLQLGLAVLVLLFSVVPALCLLYHSRRGHTKEASFPTKKNSDEEASLPTKKNSSREASLPVELHQPNAGPAHWTQNTTSICSVEEEYVKKVASFPSPSTPLLPSMKVPEEPSRQRQTPIVELLGELVIGEEKSSFVRSSKVTRKIPNSEERNASNSLSTQMIKSQSQTSLVPNQVYPTQLEVSTADSTSQKKKRPVKEEINGGEVSMSTMTPVRRSIRIRNKAMSP
ncbi:uncharacterized protein LOC108225198 [Daucus carota subsp. sativus]|uniref:uncharacterized protein LOC108225198 n=1 Tax=Daucus carota subsp. sativus TaxID=79200 RepID=UPI0007F004C8|nr:PREDICTED: uncharacterized protein LOC108225198 [Daucus carota subsp. sativus]